MDDPTLLARDLDIIVRAVPGVTAVYSAAPVIATVVTKVAKVAQLVTGGAVGGPDVSVARVAPVSAAAAAPGALAVSVSIGVSEAQPATEVCRQVYDAIAQHLVAAGETAPATISVKVGRIG